MKIQFEKYHGTGNDFIMIDGRKNDFPIYDFGLIENLCKSKFGIGADGLIAITESDKAAFQMHYFNADGKPGSMCGNGGRCAVAFAAKHDFFTRNEIIFLAFDGLHDAKVDVAMAHRKFVEVSLGMSNVSKYEWIGDDIFLDTGSPHYVTFEHVISNIDVVHAGRKIRHSSRFEASGVNVNFVETDLEKISVSTYERGVENETLSCGTGVTASAIACAIKQKKEGDLYYEVKTKGGLLEVSFTRDKDFFSNIVLKGPATHVFNGDIEI
jgi:diaminopimelate epimerase